MGAPPFLRVCAGGLPAGTKRKAGKKWRFLWKSADPWVLAVFVFKIERWRQRQRWRGLARAEERDTQRQREGETDEASPHPHPQGTAERGRELGRELGGQGGQETASPLLRSAPHLEKGLAWCPQPSQGLRPGIGGAPTDQGPVIVPSSHLLGGRAPSGTLPRRGLGTHALPSSQVPDVARALSRAIGLNINTRPARGRSPLSLRPPPLRGPLYGNRICICMLMTIFVLKRRL